MLMCHAALALNLECHGPLLDHAVNVQGALLQADMSCEVVCIHTQLKTANAWQEEVGSTDHMLSKCTKSNRCF